MYNKGIDIIEVSDDGVGIEKESYPYIALPHATSKIVHFSDIYHNHLQQRNDHSISSTTNQTTTTSESHDTESQPSSVNESQQRSSLGFRGEALHCIANLSEQLLVLTRTSSDPVATKMEFHVDGTMNASTMTTTPRKIGTTVAVLKLFHKLPVRCKDFTLHIKEQRTKLVQLIIGYAVFLSPTIRFHIMDVNMKNGKEKSLFITPYYPPSSNHRITLKDSVSSILGCNLLHKLTDITIDVSPYVQRAELINSTYYNSNKNNNKGSSDTEERTNDTTDHTWAMKGLISTGLVNATSTHPTTTTNHKSVHYFAINQRPVDLPVLSRLINKVYKSMWRTNSHTSSTSSSTVTTCTCILEFTLPLHVYDINLSPDKRKVQFWNDDVLYNLIERALIDFWTTPNNKNTDNIIGDQKVAAESFNIPTTLSQQPFQQPQSVRRNTSFSCGKASLVTAASQQSSSNPNNDNANNNNQDHDDDSINLDNIDSPVTTARRVSSTRTKDDVSLMNSSFHSAYSNDSFTSSTNRSCHRRYAFVHDPQQSIQKQHEYDYDQFIETQIVSKQEPLNSSSTAKLSPLHNNSINNNIQNEIDQKPKSNTTRLRNNEDRVRVSGFTMDRLSALETVMPSPEFVMTKNSIGDEMAISVARPSDRMKEHKQFQEVQQKFRRSDSHDSTSLLQISTTSTNDTLRGQNHDRSSMPPRKSSSLLDRFGYKVKATDACTSVNDAAPKTSNVIDRNLKSEPLQQRESKRPRTTVDEKQQNTRIKNLNVGIKSDTLKEEKQTSSTNESAVATNEITLWQGMSSEDILIASIQDRIASIQRKRQRNDPNTFSLEESEGATDDDSVAAPGVFGSIRTPSQSQNTRIKHDSNHHSLTKEDLLHLKIIGQFNLGFIIAMSPNNHLWILDQHACDERYQFELLQKRSAKFFEQPLIAPMPLELSYMEEACIVDNINVFEQNGFRLQYDETKPSRHRFSLLAVPHSGAPDGRNAVQYGKQDVQDICAILLGRSHHSRMDNEDDVDDMYSYSVHGGTGTDGTGLYGNNAVRRFAENGSGMMTLTQQSTMRDDNATDEIKGEWNQQSTAEQIIARLPKTIAMFASRACRNSIMIGKALSTKEMEKVVQHLSVVDTPWMCAHGRPTTCQVQHPDVDVSTMVQMDDRYASEHIAGPTITCLSQQDDHEQE